MNRLINLWKNFTKKQRFLIALLFLLIIAILVYIVLMQVSTDKDGAVSPLDVSDESSVRRTEASSTAIKTSVAAESETEPQPDAERNPFTGIGISSEEAESLKDRRPLLVSYDNLNDAWPQSGIASADFYMEILAEGMITRFLAIYYSNPPELIGPIRSARPYIVLKALEHDAFLAHVGGSRQALTDIIRFGVADLDGLWSGAFQRIPPKVPPHNTYARYEDLMNEAKNQGYRMSVKPDFYSFGELNGIQFQEKASVIRFDYRNYDVYGDSGYSVKYLYDEEHREYQRFVNEESCVDELDGSVVKVSNILVQYASHEVLDDDGRLAIDLFSGGEGYLFRDGKVSKVQWSKDSKESLTRFYHEDGTEIALRPGKTILHVVYPGIFQYSEE